MDKKNNNRIFLYFIIIIIIALLAVGATYAYWIWGSVRNNEANIALNISGSSGDIYAKINGGEPIETENLRLLPTVNCAGITALQRVINVTYKNGTSKLALVEAQLDLTEMSNVSQVNAPTDTELSHMHWAITTNSSSCTSNIVSSGTFEGMEFQYIYVEATGSLIGGHLENVLSNMIEHPLYGTIYPLYNIKYIDDNDDEQIIWGLPMISIAANANMANEVTNTYYLYIWIDENYTYTNYGDANDDPLSDLNFKLEWHGKIDQNLVCGDVTGDGQVTEDDQALLKAYLSQELNPLARASILGDVNGDNILFPSDLSAITAIIYASGTVACPID